MIRWRLCGDTPRIQRKSSLRKLLGQQDLASTSCGIPGGGIPCACLAAGGLFEEPVVMSLAPEFRERVHVDKRIGACHGPQSTVTWSG